MSELEAEFEALGKSVLLVARHVGVQQDAILGIFKVLAASNDAQKSILADVNEMCQHVSQWIENQGGQGWR